jgi:phosphoglycolate phosphatase
MDKTSAAWHGSRKLQEPVTMPLPPIVVFDLDGTLAETAPDLIATLNVILRQEGMMELPLEKARDMIGAGAKALIQRAFDVAGRDLPPARLDILFVQYLDHYRAHIADLTELFPGVIPALDSLQQDGFLLAVCTNKLEEHARLLLAELGVMHRFASLTGKDTFAFSKPDPRHLLETIRLAGGDPLRAVMVGDSRTDIDTAKAAGIPVIGVPFGYTDVPMHALGADVVVAHFDDLAGAVRSLLPTPA